MSFTSPGSPKEVICWTDQSADETLGQWIDARGYANISFFITATGTGVTSSGVISFESAAPIVAGSGPFGTATDGYSVITTVNASDVTGAKQKQIAFPPNVAYAFVRPRISTAIGGGGKTTVTAELS